MRQKHIKQTVSIFILSILLSVKLFAHKEPTHQYIVKEAYQLLKNQIGTVPQMEDYVGTNDGRCACQFQSQFIVGGAWAEDQQDPVYNLFSTGIPVPILDYLGNNYVAQLGSVSHFWEADGSNTAADNTTLALSNTLFSSYGHLGPYPNAYKKALAYKNGGFIFTDKLNIANSELAYSTYFAQYRYDGLINLYKTGSIYCYGLWDLIGRQILPAGWVTLTDSEGKRIAYNILGRIAHLLADMSVPAHIHNDEHALFLNEFTIQEGKDRYENKVNVDGSNQNFAKYWNANNIIGGFINPYECSDPLYGLMYGTNQIADQFASNRYDGDKNYVLTNYTGIPEWKTIVDNTVCNSSSANYSDDDLEKIRDVTFPYVIRSTAGLFYWFARETGLIPMIVPFEYSDLSVALTHATTGQTVRVLPGTHDLTTTATVPTGVRLEIMPGTTLRFNNNSRLIVNGELIAEGTPNERIIFDGLSQTWQNDWTDGLIRINGMSESNSVVITNADIKNSNCLVYANHPYGLSISDCSFSNFGLSPIGYALEVYDCTSTVSFVNNTITGNWPNEYDDIYDRGSGIIVDAQVVLAGYGVNIYGNTITKCFKGIRVINSYPLLQNNQVYNNAYGIDLNSAGMLTSNPRIILNNIHTNAYYGLIFQHSSVYLSMNRIADNYIGMYLYASSPSFHDNLILNNLNQQIICEGISQPVFGAIDQGLNNCGYNKISGGIWSSDLITASGNSYVELGIYDPGNEGNLSGYNSLIRNNPIGKHISVANAYVAAQFNYWNSPIVTVGNVDTYNQLEYDPTPFPPLPWSTIQLKNGNSTPVELSGIFNKTTSSKNTNLNYSTILLNIVNVKFDSAMRKRSKEEVLLSLGASYSAKGMYGKAKDIFEIIVKGSRRTKFDTPALIQLYGAYQKELFDSSTTSVSRRVDVKDIFKQRLMNIGVYNSNREINNITNLMLAREMMRFGQYDNAISAYNYVVEQSGFQQETKLSLYDLFTIYLKGKKDTLSALNYLNRLENIFPDDKLISLAKSEIGISDKNNRGSLSKSQLISKTKPDNKNSIPESFGLTQNYPNPFNPTTTINYQLPEDAYVKLIIYDIHGREIASLHNGLNAAGYYESQWNGKTKNNYSVASGVYFYRLTAKSLVRSNTTFVSTKKMLMMK